MTKLQQKALVEIAALVGLAKTKAAVAAKGSMSAERLHAEVQEIADILAQADEWSGALSEEQPK